MFKNIRSKNELKVCLIFKYQNYIFLKIIKIFLQYPGDHGGILVAAKYYKTEGATNELLYSTNEGIDWKPLKFYEKLLKVYGLLTEPGENSTTFTVFGTEHGGSSVNWIIVTVSLYFISSYPWNFNIGITID